MRAITLLFLLLMLPCLPALTPAQVREQALSQHNALRAGEGAASMKRMVWSDVLAEMAKAWADDCYFEHGQPVGYDEETRPHTNIGQNLYITNGTLNVTHGIQSWFDEKTYYNLRTNTCPDGKTCGHYKKLVWDKSYELGCGAAYCSILTSDTTSSNNAKYLVCNYGPAGDYVNQVPFVVGPACTQCPDGHFTCDGGLCNHQPMSNCPDCTCEVACLNRGTVTDDCRCDCNDGYHGTNCGDVCENTDTRCGKGWAIDLCNHHRHGATVMTACPVMCCQCVPASGPTGKCLTISTTPQYEATNHCDSLICQNSGTAVYANSACQCQCTADFHGDNCEHGNEKSDDVQSNDGTQYSAVNQAQAPLSGNLAQTDGELEEAVGPERWMIGMIVGAVMLVLIVAAAIGMMIHTNMKSQVTHEYEMSMNAEYEK